MKEPVEPTVLDYVKSKLRFGRGGRIELPSAVAEEKVVEPSEPSIRPGRPWPWRSLSALALALIAQNSFEPAPNVGRTGLLGSVLYVAALGLLILAYRRGEWNFPFLPAPESGLDPLTIRWVPFVISLLLGAVTFYFMKDNTFTAFNLTLWAFTIVTHMSAVWLRNPQDDSLWNRVRRFFARPSWDVRITRWTLLVVVVVGLTLFFRFYLLSEVPIDMTSDHAEKLLDVNDILHGQYSIFFPRNTGREPLYVYLSALIAAWYSGISFMTLKIAAVIGGLAMLPYLYLLGKELGGKRIGLLAVLFAGIAYWPNVIERFGLRISFYPLFVAPTFYYLIRGFRRKSRNDMILSGISLGLGLNGYTPFRIMPFVIVAAFLVYLLHTRSSQERKQAVIWLVLLALTAWVLYLPQARYALEHPDEYGFRAFSRLGSVERPLPGPAWQIFLSNLWNALKMFNWDNGGIWVHSVVGRPALDVVSAALFLAGAVLVLIRYLRSRQWTDLFMLLSVPLLLMPSILSLAFPAENPSLNRTGGAIIPAFLFVGLALDGLLTGMGFRAGSLEDEHRSAIQSRVTRPILAILVVLALTVVSSVQNYDLVFRQYYLQYKDAAWNTREMGDIMREFKLTQGSANNIWIIPYPYWVDTRLPSMWAGVPERGDIAITTDGLAETESIPDAKLFMFRIDDTATLEALKHIYPRGILSVYKSARGDNFNFYLFLVPALNAASVAP